MEVVVQVKDREAIPVRAIPFVTGWMMSPDMVAAALAFTDLMKRMKDVFAYHVHPTGFSKMLPKEWDNVEADLQSLSDKLKATEEIDQESYAEWRSRSVGLLPAGVFVWKDEFERAFSAAYNSAHLGLMDERPGDRDLNFTPRIPAGMHRTVLEGFWRKASETFESLEFSLDGHFDKSLAELPEKLQELVELELWPYSWDSFAAEHRRSLAEQLDYQHDPATEGEREYFFNLWCEIDAVQQQITDWELIATPTAIDKATKEDRLGLLRSQLETLQAQYREAPADNDAAADAETRPSSWRRTRTDAMSAEIEDAIRTIGADPTPYQVMHKLKGIAGKGGSCITENGNDFVLWQNASGEKLKLDMANLRKRLERRNQRNR